MRLTHIDSVAQARQKLYSYAPALSPGTEMLPLACCAGRVLAKDVYAPADIPAFDRSAVDGYAVVAADTAAAGESLPVMLTTVGDIKIGQPAGFSIKSGQCAYVPTGGMLPAGADAVVMVEYSEPFGSDGIALYKPAACGEHVVYRGEDMPSGGLLIHKGKRLRASEIGALAAAGLTDALCYKRLRLTIISTGDELVTPGTPLPEGCVYDINTHALAALAEANGFIVVRAEVAADDADKLEHTVRAALSDSDIVAVSGGSSRGKADYTAEVFKRIATPGIFTYGIAVKPGKPTLFAYDAPSNTLLAGLPGHPVSALVVFETFLCDLYRRLTGCAPPPAVTANLTVNMPSSPGKHTFYPVTLHWDETAGIYTATPVFGKSGLITTLTRADGFFEINSDTEGIPAGGIIRVRLWGE